MVNFTMVNSMTQETQNNISEINITVAVPGLQKATIHLKFHHDLLTYASLSIGDFMPYTIVVYKDEALWTLVRYFGEELWLRDNSSRHVNEFFDFIEALTKLEDADIDVEVLE